MALWVFGYGSLLWDPGFEVAETQLASLEDYARSFCMRSIHHRGTETEPGLVLALDAAVGAVCNGVALRAAPGSEDATLAYLRDRELISSAYVERHVPLGLADGRRIEALAYVINRQHWQYCRDVPLEEQARIIASAVGGRGPNSEYLWNTTDHLTELGIEDADLHWLSERVRTLLGGS